jgi:hypothetical protein
MAARRRPSQQLLTYRPEQGAGKEPRCRVGAVHPAQLFELIVMHKQKLLFSTSYPRALSWIPPARR